MRPPPNTEDVFLPEQPGPIHPCDDAQLTVCQAKAGVRTLEDLGVTGGLHRLPRPVGHILVYVKSHGLIECLRATVSASVAAIRV